MDFKEFRTKHKLTLEKAGKLLGRSDTYWSDLQRGNRIPDTKIPAIIRVLNLYNNGHYSEIRKLKKQITPDYIRQLRGEMGLNSRQMGGCFGIAYSTWKNMELGFNPISDHFKTLIAAFVLENQLSKTEPTPPVIVAEQDNVINEQRSGLINLPYNSNPIRYKEINGEPWFVLRDVCDAIEYENISNAIRLIEHDDLQKLSVIDIQGRNQEAWFVNESGLYQFLLSSRVEKARPFSKWVTKKVLPTIRKTGGYNHQVDLKDPVDILKIQQKAVQLIIEEMESQRVRFSRLETKLEEVEQKIDVIPQVNIETTAKATIDALAQLNAKKADLYDAVHRIVRRAKQLSDDDPEANMYAQYGTTWRAVHRFSRPRVKSLNDYTSIEQIESAIHGAESILLHLGIAPKSEQLVIKEISFI